jgi:hypothetical protein
MVTSEQIEIYLSVVVNRVVCMYVCVCVCRSNMSASRMFLISAITLVHHTTEMLEFPTLWINFWPEIPPTKRYACVCVCVVV